MDNDNDLLYAAGLMLRLVGVVVLLSAFAAMLRAQREEREREPEYIVTSMGRKLYTEVDARGTVTYSPSPVKEFPVINRE